MLDERFPNTGNNGGKCSDALGSSQFEEIGQLITVTHHI